MNKVLVVLCIIFLAFTSCDNGNTGGAGCGGSGSWDGSSSGGWDGSSSGGAPTVVEDTTPHADNWPLSGALWAHDPGIIKAENVYYVFSTGTSSTISILVKRSYDGENWRDIGGVFNSCPSWVYRNVPVHTPHFWAPDISYYNGKYYLYYSVSSFGSNNSAIGLATTTNIAAGNWQDQGMVINSTSGDNYNCIDPNMVVDQSGRPWLAFGSFWGGLHIVELNPSTMKPLSGAEPIQLATNSSTAIEAPDIVYRQGYYYLFASRDKCCNGAASTYKIIYGRASNITGPYVDKNGKCMLDGGGTLFDTGNGQWRGPGGQSLLGTTAIAHHAYDAYNKGEATLMIKNLYWDSAGWPYHN